MTCPVATSTLAIIQAVRDLQERVAVLVPEPTLPSNLLTMCGGGNGVGLIPDIIGRVLAFVNAAGSDVTEDAARPDMPTPQTCISGGWLSDIETWIDGIDLARTSICDLNLNSAGGDEGYDETFYAGNGGYTLELTYNTYVQKDRIILYNQNNVVMYDSGCVGTDGNVVAEIAVPAGTTGIRVVVEPNCEGGSGTAWILSVRCV